MTEQTSPQIPRRAAREEKLAAIAALFGEAVAARLGEGTAPVTDRTGGGDPDRLAWQTNRLIRHLRDRSEAPAAVATPAQGTHRAQDTPGTPGAAATTAPRGAPAMPVLREGEDLAAEHPAVIAHLLRGEPQGVRVAVLRALPGQVARAVMRRMRPD